MSSTIVLHHGMCGFDVLQLGLARFHYWQRIDEAIARRGYPLLVTCVHPTAGIKRRAGELKDQILRHLEDRGEPDERVVIIAHSMGGLDARYMISHFGMAERVTALVTISTGHRGTPYMEWFVRTFDSLGHLRVFHMTFQDIGALWEATPEYCRRFNEEVPNSTSVRYFSITAACPRDRVPPTLWHSYSLVAEAEGENDGGVSVQSAHWGEHIETWPVDHFHQINWPMPSASKEIAEDVTPRYMALLDRLAKLDLLSTANRRRLGGHS